MITEGQELKADFIKGLKKYLSQNLKMEKYFSQDLDMAFTKSKVEEMHQIVINELLSKLPEVVDRTIFKHGRELDFLLIKEEKEKYIHDYIKYSGKCYVGWNVSDWFSIEGFENEIFDKEVVSRITHLYLEEKAKDDRCSGSLPRSDDGILYLSTKISLIIGIRILKHEYYLLKTKSDNNGKNKQYQNFFDKKVGKTKTRVEERLWFKSGVLFANGSMDKYWNKAKTGIKNEYTTPFIAKEIGMPKAEKYLLASFKNYSNSDKNIFNHRDKMEIIIKRLEEENIEISSSFLDKLPPKPY